MKHTLIALAARACLDAAGLKPSRRISISWTSYIAAGGPKVQR